SSRFTVSNNVIHGLQQSGEGDLRHAIFAKGVDNRILNNYMIDNNTSVGPFRSGDTNQGFEVKRNIMSNSGDVIYRFADWSLERFASADYQLLHNDNGVYGISGAPDVFDFDDWKTFNNYK